MYEVFDNFLNTPTWHTNHDNDQGRFYQALKTVVENPNFNPEEMGNYFRETKQVSSEDHPYADRIDDLVKSAWNVLDFLKMTGSTIT